MEYLEPIDWERAEFVEHYDELPLWSAPFGLLLLERVPVRAGITILDVGAGTGFLTLELAERCGPSATVIAVDPWGAAMARLRRRVEYLGLANVRLLEQDAAALDLPAASVDLVVSNLGLNNFADPEAVLRACRRVVKQEGRLILATNPVGHMAELYDVFRATLIDAGHSDRLAALEAHIQHRGTKGSIEELLARTGFEVVAVDSSRFRLRFADGSSLLRHHLIRLGFLQQWRSILPVEAVERTLQALERRLNDVAASRGALTLTVPVLCLEARPCDPSGGCGPAPRPGRDA